MNLRINLWLGLVFVVLLSACGAPTPVVPTPVPTPSPAAVKIDVVVIKKVAVPTDRVADFAVVELDGKYTVHFDESKCMVDDKPYMYGPYDSIKHCEILEQNVLQGIISDQAWLKEDLSQYIPYLHCIHGWVYLGRDQKGKEEWFVEGFAFDICGQ